MGCYTAGNQLKKGESLKALTLRLPDEKFDDLTLAAQRLGIPPAVLARAFVIGALDAGTDLMQPPKITTAAQVIAPVEAPLPSPTQGSGSNRRKKKRGR